MVTTPPRKSINCGSTAAAEPFQLDLVVSLQTLKHEYLVWILQRANGNKAEAARLLQIDRSSLYRLFRSLPSDVRQALSEPDSESPDPRSGSVEPRSGSVDCDSACEES